MANDRERGAELTSQQQEKLRLIAQEIQDQRQVLETLLGGDVGWDAFVRATTTALRGNPFILTMPADSLVNACFHAAQDRLLPDGKQGAILPRYNSKTKRTEATWQPMYQGILLVAKKYAGVKNIDVELVFEGERFRSMKGTNPGIEHEQDVTKFDLDKIVAAYAVVWLTDGTYKSEVMDRASLEAAREASEAYKKGFATPWKGPFRGEMYRKTVVHRTWKWIPATGENAHIVQNAISRIEGEIAGMPQRDTLAEAGVKPRQIAAPDPIGNLAGVADMRGDMEEIIGQQLPTLHDRDAVEVWLMEPERHEWMMGLRRNQPKNYDRIRTLIEQHLAVVDPASRESGVDEVEGLPIVVPNRDAPGEWIAGDVRPRDGLTLPEAYVVAWRSVLTVDALRADPDLPDAMHRMNHPRLEGIADRGPAYERAALEAMRLVDAAKAWIVRQREKAAARAAKMSGTDDMRNEVASAK